MNTGTAVAAIEGAIENADVIAEGGDSGLVVVSWRHVRIRNRHVAEDRSIIQLDQCVIVGRSILNVEPCTFAAPGECEVLGQFNATSADLIHMIKYEGVTCLECFGQGCEFV